MISVVAASEPERAQTGMRAFRGSDRKIDSTRVAEWHWKDQRDRVKAPYAKLKLTWRYPEYHETRETLWEGRGTTP